MVMLTGESQELLSGRDTILLFLSHPASVSREHQLCAQKLPGEQMSVFHLKLPFVSHSH